MPTAGEAINGEGSAALPRDTPMPLRYESTDADQRYRDALVSFARYLLPVDKLLRVLASSLNDGHVTAGWVPLQAAQANFRLFLERHSSPAPVYQHGDAHNIACLLAIQAERLIYCPLSFSHYHAAVDEGLPLPPSLTGHFTASAPAVDLKPFQLACNYADQAKLVMLLSQEFEEMSPVSVHTYYRALTCLTLGDAAV